MRSVGVHAPISLPPEMAPFHISVFCDCHFSTGVLCDPLPHRFDHSSVWTFLWGWPYSQLLGPGLAAQPTESFLRASLLYSWLLHRDQRSDPEAFAESNTVTQGCQLQVESGATPRAVMSTGPSHTRLPGSESWLLFQGN